MLENCFWKLSLTKLPPRLLKCHNYFTVEQCVEYFCFMTVHTLKHVTTLQSNDILDLCLCFLVFFLMKKPFYEQKVILLVCSLLGNAIDSSIPANYSFLKGELHSSFWDPFNILFWCHSTLYHFKCLNSSIYITLGKSQNSCDCSEIWCATAYTPFSDFPMLAGM